MSDKPHCVEEEAISRALDEVYRRLIPPGSGLLLAVSGGADSLALLGGSARVARKRRLVLEVATLDHGLRAEAAAEVRAVEALCGSLGLPCHPRRIDVGAGPGLEARARAARYAQLEAIRAERKLDWIATGHTASDQAETLLMRLARGSSLKGAAGILERRGRVIRPLLSATREQTRAFVASLGWHAASDPSNADARYFRARVRGHVLPALEHATGKHVVSRLADFARWAREDAAHLDALAEEAWERAHLGAGLLQRRELLVQPEPLRRRVLVRLLSESGQTVRASSLRAAEAAVRAGGRGALTREAWVDARQGVVRVVRRQAVAAPAPVQVGSAWAAAPAFALEFRCGAPGSGDAVLFAAGRGAEGAGPYCVRQRRPGDRVLTRAGTKKLQDLLVDLRVLAELRDLLPVVTQADGTIVWLPGIWPERADADAYLHARLIPGGQAPEWLVRYRLANNSGAVAVEAPNAGQWKG